MISVLDIVALGFLGLREVPPIVIAYSYGQVGGQSIILMTYPGSIPGNVVELSQRERTLHRIIHQINLTDAEDKITKEVHTTCHFL
jgi:hypothetical protein